GVRIAETGRTSRPVAAPDARSPGAGESGRARIRGRSGRWRPRVAARARLRPRRPVWSLPRLDTRIPSSRSTMSETRSTKPKERGWASAGVTAMLALSAAVTVGYWSFRALERPDTEAMESPLMLSVARQLVAGPWGLYGPYGESNPLVLIHAPL